MSATDIFQFFLLAILYLAIGLRSYEVDKRLKKLEENKNIEEV